MYNKQKPGPEKMNTFLKYSLTLSNTALLGF